MSIKISNIKNATKLPLEVDAWKLIDSEKVKAINLLIHPGESVAPHDNELDVMFYVLSGEGELVIDEATYLLSKGDSLVVKPGSIRAWNNDSDDDLSVLVLKLEV